MKTFKLKGLKIMEDQDSATKRKKISLIDGLVINREDESGWIIEAYIEDSYKQYFESIINTEELMVQVKITREDNDPAFFITEIISVNAIDDGTINVLFQGKVVDHRNSRIEEMLEMIIEEGYQGESLLKKFKELI